MKSCVLVLLFREGHHPDTVAERSGKHNMSKPTTPIEIHTEPVSFSAALGVTG